MRGERETERKKERKKEKRKEKKYMYKTSRNDRDDRGIKKSQKKGK